MTVLEDTVAKIGKLPPQERLGAVNESLQRVVWWKNPQSRPALSFNAALITMLRERNIWP